MMLALALLLAQVDPTGKDPCTVAKSLVRAAPDFQSVKGAANKRQEHRTQWTNPVRFPGASRCYVFDEDDGSPSWYACELHVTSCRLTEKKYEALAAELSCLGAGHEENDGKKRQTSWSPRKDVGARLVFSKGESCRFRFLVEPDRK